MSKIDRIIFNRNYKLYLQKNADEEIDRPFCSHHFEHLLDVARLTYIILLEEGSPFISREMAYAAGLLHDIGRWQEYRSEKDHAKFSAELAEAILIEAEFSEAERHLIIKAIEQHRLKNNCLPHRSPLSAALSKADSLSRLCFRCDARGLCNKLEQQPHRDKLLY